MQIYISIQLRVRTQYKQYLHIRYVLQSANITCAHAMENGRFRRRFTNETMSPVLNIVSTFMSMPSPSDWKNAFEAIERPRAEEEDEKKK